MIRSYRELGVCLLLVLQALLATTPLQADDDAEKKAEEQRKAAYVRALRALAEGLTVSGRTVDGETECAMVNEPVLNWSDSARHPDLLVPGTTWIRHQNGLPLGARCVVRLDEKEYWTCPEHSGDAKDPRKGFSKYVAIDESVPDEANPK